MKVILDIECNGLHNPDKIWVIVCRDISTHSSAVEHATDNREVPGSNPGGYTIFRNVTDDEQEKERFLNFAKSVETWIGHNIMGYDLPNLNRLVNLQYDVSTVLDTLIVSKLIGYSRVGGHSLEAYGKEFGLEKIDIGKSIAGHNPFFDKYSLEMENYCVRDVDINLKVYLKYLPYYTNPSWIPSIQTEIRFQAIVNDLHSNGFGYNLPRATTHLREIVEGLAKLDTQILTAFPPREVLIREFVPKLTKFGTISRTSVPRMLHPNIHKYESGKTYKHTRLDPFNPASHKQVIEVLNEAGWKPEDKTKTHIETEREINLRKRARLPIQDLTDKLNKLKISGWKINENNLTTLPEGAPAPARLLAQRILLESRRRSLVEQIDHCKDGRIHGEFQGIGAWTHRMSHQKPNTANIPAEFNTVDGSVKFLGKQMRELWIAPKNRLLVGVDAEGIQLRIFAHLINDQEFTNALVTGKKSDKTDPHSFNQRILGPACKTRQAAKRFVYALLLGGGLSKLAVILGCSNAQAKEALDRLLERYTGFALLKKSIIPKDGKRGYFIGLDGRQVPIPGETQRDREHLAMSGYLQNGEAIIIKRAAIYTDDQLKKEKELKKWMFVNIVHDELQMEVRNSMDFAIRVAKITAEAIRQAGEDLKLRCPMAGSYWNDDTNDYTIGTNWYQTH